MTGQHNQMFLALPGHDSPPAPCRAIRDWLRRNADLYGGNVAVSGLDRPDLSHEALDRHIRAIGDNLLARGIGRGDIVMIGLGNGPEALTAILSVASVAVAFPIAPEEPEESIERLIGRVPVKAVLFDGGRRTALRRLGERNGLACLPIEINPLEPAGAFSLSGGPADAEPATEPTRIDDAAVLVKTAGTTAEPKIVAWSQTSLYLSADAAADWMGLDRDDRSLCMMPFSHLHSVVRSTMPGLLTGGGTVCCPGFDKVRVLDWIREFQPTYMTAVSGIYRTILARTAESGHPPDHSSFRFLATGSDSIDPNTIEELTRAFGVPVREFYGMSEVAPMLAVTPAGQAARAGGAVGVPLDCWSLACLDDEGRPLAPGREGEIAAKGGLINPVVGRGGGESRLSADGWFLTGDSGWIDDHGQLHVSGRVDDRITRGGKKIAPTAVEEALAAHPQVARAVVFPLPDPVYGEQVAALAVPVDDADPGEEDLRVFVAGKLPDYMVPIRIVVSSTVPATPAGKVARRELARSLGIQSPTTAPAAPGRREPASPTEAGVAELVGRLLEIEDFDLDARFEDLGGDSFFALSLLTAVDERFGHLLSPAQLLQNGSAGGLARLIDELGAVESAAPRIITVQQGNSEAPIFFTHSPEGFAYFAQSFIPHFEGDQTVYGFQWREPDGGFGPGITLESYAADCVSAMSALQPSGPYFLAGHSFGAYLAFEIAQQLFQHGQEVAFLALIDGNCHLSERRFGIVAQARKARTVFEKCKYLGRAYVPEAYPGDITLFQAGLKPLGALADPTTGWGDLAFGKVERIEVEGDHETIMHGPGVAQWGGQLAERMAAARRDGTGNRGAPRDTAAEHRRRPDVQAATRARRAAKSGDLDAEIAHYREAIRCNSAQPHWVYGNLGGALRQRGDLEAALDAFRQSIERQEIPIVGYRDAVRCLWDLGRPDEARAYARDGARRASDEPHAQFAVAEMWYSIGSMNEAASAYRRAASLEPDFVRAHYKLSLALDRLGRLDEAIDAAGKTIELRPRKRVFHFYLANLLAKEGNLKRALAVFMRARELETERGGQPTMEVFNGLRERVCYLVFLITRRVMLLRRRRVRVPAEVDAVPRQKSP